ncbi:uncharacterized protein LOC109860766 isoform X2 [Pseudomyrmex gracilis]|uniref:uncharacterized protein LOC109860766 isoform X2 n=1 Tax=Pseudomyrmex gracilis TaxID=219809 RepID=UPI0009958D1B|nr:uncharacterized protein LOC109860766 isoform X2 [Pseudomyrmex gracilis]
MKLQSKTSSGIEKPLHFNSNEYFMGIAILIEKQSEKGCYPVGACIVNSDQTIVGTGYNTLQKGWDKEKDIRPLFLYHAEVAAILNKTSTDVKGCTMYVTQFPCNNCANRIISSGIKKIIYCDMKRDHAHTTTRIQAAKEIFAANGVTYTECTTIYDKLVPEAYCRFSRLTNEECFMGIAHLSSKQSGNEEKIGACIVNNHNVIVGVEYNSLSRKMDQISLSSLQKNIPASYFNVCYADFIINLILSTSCDVKNCTMYVTSFPCNESAKVIVQSGIKTVIYLRKTTDDKTKAAKKMFDADKVKHRQFGVKISNIEIFRSESTTDLNTVIELMKKLQIQKENQVKEDGKKIKKKKQTNQTKSTNKIESGSKDLHATTEVSKKVQTGTKHQEKRGEKKGKKNRSKSQTKSTNNIKSGIPTGFNLSATTSEHNRSSQTSVHILRATTITQETLFIYYG